jgi:hypothetical protein
MPKTSKDKFAFSRTAVEEFIRCARCFYIHRKLKIKPIAQVPLTLASATDSLLKNEFDAVRGTDERHPLWLREGLNVRAFSHPSLDSWRNNLKGQRVVHGSTGVTVFGAIDDLWENLDTGELHIVDYKSTAKKGMPDLGGGFGPSYKRQMEFYQWLYCQAGFRISPVGYFLYVNGSKEGRFYVNDKWRMIFETTLIAHEGNKDWVDPTLKKMVSCFNAEEIPLSDPNCDSCRYVRVRQELPFQ